MNAPCQSDEGRSGGDPAQRSRSTRQSSALRLLVAAPRGFCAGVDRAIEIVERAIEIYGAPVYVRHEIVHNRFVVDQLKARGAVFVEDLCEVPDGATVIFSAHGVPKSVPEAADARKLEWLDATCPLVSKAIARPSGRSRPDATCCSSVIAATRR
jgi:4-hydroxy-3-methylbut-2-enyl diphosphate reductase